MMTSGTIFKQRDIFIVPFPFSDLSSSKKRPVLILSHSSHNSSHLDIIVSAITSSSKRFSSGVIINNRDMDIGSLLKMSAVRFDTVFTISKNKIDKYVGKLNKNKSKNVVKMLDKLIEIKE